ncbi:MAG: hypothetical protein QG599_2894 [Pseudomonadota bacterium]|nr:hypothetical protein [Pseudomonadota bacterium]
MNTLQIRDAKAVFSAVIAAAEQGRPTLITRHGRPSAMVVPVEDGRRLYPDHLPSFADYLLSMPAAPELSIERDTSSLREVDW